MKGLEKFFSSKQCPLPISHGEMWKTAKGVRLVTYLLPLMEGVNLQACAQAAQCGFAIQANGSRLSTSRGCDFSQLLLHGTTVKNALSILCDGRINPSPGIAGDGIYGFEVKGEEKTHIEAGWNQTTAGQCNWGAAFLMRCGGIVAKTKSDNVIPDGAVGKNKDQFAAAPGSVTDISVTFNA